MPLSASKELVTPLNKGYFEHQEQRCIKERGAHLVSIHSKQDVNDISNICSNRDESCNGCWVGIMMDSCIDDNRYNLSWIDKSNNMMLTNYSNMLWCDDYPNNLCNESYVYVDLNMKCLKNMDDTLECAVCGEPFECSTNGVELFREYQVFCIIYCYIFLVISSISFSRMYYHLYKANYWKQRLSDQEPSKAVRRSAACIPFLQIIIYFIVASWSSTILITCDNNFTRSLNTEYLLYHYPFLKLLWIPAIIGGVCFILSVFVMFPLHFVLRVQDAFSKNDVMQKALISKTEMVSTNNKNNNNNNNMYCKCKYFFHIIYVIIIIQSFTAIGWIIVIHLQNDGLSHAALYKNLLIIYLCLSEATINCILLRMYLIGVHKQSDSYFRYDYIAKYNNINDPQQECMLEAARYSVTFAVCVGLNILLDVLAVIGVIYEINVTIPGFVENFAAVIYVSLRVNISLFAVHYSFPFLHHRYEVICYLCDKSMKQFCQKKEIERNRRALQQQIHIKRNRRALHLEMVEPTK